MMLDDVLEMLESESIDDRKARRMADYFDLYEADDTLYRQNRKFKHDYDDESKHGIGLNKRRSAKYDRSKRL